MGIKVILHVSPRSVSRDGFDLLLRRYKLDFSAVLELALEHWDELGSTRDHDVLISAMEKHIALRLGRRKANYEDMLQAAQALATAAEAFYEAMSRVLYPIVDTRYSDRDVSLKLTGWMDRAAIIQIDPRTV